MSMRTSYIAFGTIATLAAALAACSGGGSSSTPSVGNSAVQAPPSSFGTTVTGPAGSITVSIAIPHRPAASAALAASVHAKFGPKHADAHIRSMANTSKTALVRATGAQINRYAAQFEGSNRRSAQYVGPTTYYVELVVTNSANTQTIADEVQTCQSQASTCNNTFSVGVGTGYNVSLFLYDDCGYLLSAGTSSGVSISQTTPTTISINLSGVVAYLGVSPNNSAPLIADASKAQSFNVGVSLLDADYNTITLPGQPVDETLTPITSVVLSTSGESGDLTPASNQTLTVAAVATPSPAPSASPTSYPNQPFILTTGTYSYSGTGGEANITFSAQAVTSGSPILPNLAFANGPYGYGNYNSSVESLSSTLKVNQVQLIFTNPEGFPNPEGSPYPDYSPGYYSPGQGPGLNPLPGSSPSPSPSSFPSSFPSSSPSSGPDNDLFVPQFSQVSTSLWALEFPNLETGNGQGYVGLQELAENGTVVPFAGTVTLTDNGSCQSVIGYPTSAFGFTAGNANVVLSAYNQNSPNGSCKITATDSSAFHRTAQLEFFFDNPSLTIQSHARSAK